MAEREIKITIVGDATKAKQTFTETGQAATTFEGKVEGLSGKWGNFSTVLSGVVAAGALGKVAGWLKDGAMGAAEDAAALDQLKSAVQNTGVSYDDYADSIDEAVKKSQDLAFSDGETLKALELLTDSTGSVEEAMNRLGPAQDLARAKGISLEAAAKLLGRVNDENTGILKKYGLQLDENATAQDVLNEVDAKFGGRAGSFAESDAGKMAKAQLQMGELAETIGGMLIPVFALLATVLLTVLTALQPVFEFIGNNLIPILLVLAPALIAVGVAIMTSVVPAAYSAATAFLIANAAMLPLIAVLLAIGVAIAALYLAWTSNFLGIRDITQQVIDFIWPYIQTVMTNIQLLFDTVWPYLKTVVETYLLAIQVVIQTVLDAIKVYWELIWTAVQLFMDYIWPIIQTVVSIYINAVLTIITTVLGLIRDVWNTIWPPLQTTVETVMSGVQTAINVLYTVKDTIGAVLGALRDEVWNPVWDGILSKVVDIWNGASGIFSTVSSAITSVYNTIRGALRGGGDTIQGIWDSTWDAISGKVYDIWEGIKGFVRTGVQVVVDLINGLIDVYNKLPFVDDIEHVGNPLGASSAPSGMSGGGPGPGGGGGPGTAPGQKPPTNQDTGGGPGTGGGVKPPKQGDETDESVVDPLAGTGNLSGNSGGLSGGGGGSKSGGNSSVIEAEIPSESIKTLSDTIRQDQSDFLTKLLTELPARIEKAVAVGIRRGMSGIS